MTTFQNLLTLAMVLVACFGSGSDSAAQTQTLTAFYTAPVASMRRCGSLKK
jgi:hypothetical protein